ncbi:choline/glycine/proline betaine transport protein [Thiohalospira halophila DSM 15071]|uniref:Choline/glycine/proline betaine transport protein n=1 Tax=Thiohalospira halophila DSM 15071 TaxID=1123397 RepID=A0A1I1TSD1_9GAMM|nr:BCCT family transporter [Thiohalospira halophila]SFD61275.1 choline/glycine/proline betaine transport protein [Thiohalospira halophila DSM 15071]
MSEPETPPPGPPAEAKTGPLAWFRAFFATVNPAVFTASAGVILAFVFYGVLLPEQANRVFSSIQGFITEYLGWLYLVVVTFFLAFLIWLGLSRYGRIRLGSPDEAPRFGFVAWFSMLFSAGMGIGLVFWSVAEPILHYQNPPAGEGGTPAAAEQAMVYAFFHWGLHAWAVYVVLGLSVAYFSFRYQLPLTIRSIFFPLLGNRIYGPFGHVIDVLAVFGTLFGLATSLGLGVMQLNTGLHTLVGMPVSHWHQVGLIGVITTIAVLSVISGLDRGLKWLSVFNLGLALTLLGFVLLAGPTLFIIRFFLDATGGYLQQLIELSLTADAVGGSTWQKDWTMFYWAWWIAWSPFVGIFIARVSRGRTIREFIVGVLALPSLFVGLWMATFGGTALHLELFGGEAGIAAAVAEDTTTALYVTLAELPWPTLASAVATLLIATYFVTSSDSGTHVVDALISRGSTRSPKRQRVIWGILEGAVAATLLVVGGEQALASLQTGSIAAGLPVAVILVFACFSLLRSLQREYRVEGARPPWGT